MKRSVCAVPFSMSSIPVVNNFNFFMAGYCIASVVTPRGLGIDGRDIGFIENRSPLGFTATSDLEKSIQCCDVVLVLYTESASPLYSYAVHALDEAIQSKKDVFCLLDLEETEKEKYRRIASQQKTEIWFAEQGIFLAPSYLEITSPLYKPFAPVVFVGELAEKVQSYEVFCNLLNSFTQSGIKVSGISTEPATTLFGHHSIDLSQVQDNPAHHVYCISKYIKEIESREHPALILIHLPKPMIKFDEDVKYDFGISAYMISQAISPAYFIVCSPFGFFSSDFWVNMSQNFESKFGYPIDMVHMSNKIIDSSNGEKSRVHFIHRPMEDTASIIRELSDMNNPVPIVNLLNIQTAVKIADNVRKAVLDLSYGLIGGV